MQNNNNLRPIPWNRAAASELAVMIAELRQESFTPVEAIKRLDEIAVNIAVAHKWELQKAIAEMVEHRAEAVNSGEPIAWDNGEPVYLGDGI